MQANNDVLYGIRIMASLLSTGALKVSSACDALIKEMPAYAWDSKESEKGIDKPIKVCRPQHRQL